MMQSKLIAIATIFSAIAKTMQIYRSECRRDVLFKIAARNARLDVVTISIKALARLHLCAKACLDESACKSINYNAVTGSCHTLSRNRQDVSSDKMKSDDGWNFYQPFYYEVRTIAMILG